MDPIDIAIGLARAAHRGQVDKQGMPYVLHPLRVGASLAAFGPDAVCAGILHDVVEDTPVTLDDLRDFGFSERVISAVDAVTKTTSERDLEAYRASILRAMADPVGLWVKAADVLDNAGRIYGLSDGSTKARLMLKYGMAADLFATVIPRFPTGGLLWRLAPKYRPLTPPKDWNP